MDDLLRDFLTETAEHLDTVDAELVRFEQDPADRAILRNIFRLVHTIKGTCGFLGLPRLEALAHAAETLMGRLRDGMPVTGEAVTLILASIDRIKLIMAGLDRSGSEPEGTDLDIIAELEFAAAALTAPTARPRRLKPGEVSLEELERVFQAAPGPERSAAPPPPPSDRPDTPAQPEAGPGRAQTIRVALDTLEGLMTTVSELVLTRNQLLDTARRTGGHEGFAVPLQRLSQVTAELQDGIMKTRMQPIGSVWAKLPRILRDLGPELGKRIELVMQGAETELDRQVLEQVRDPLTHMIRNAADHGIERPDERIRTGKPPHGTIRLNAFHEGGTITIEVADDGAGLDHEAIRNRVRSRGLLGEAELARMSDDQVAAMIFQPGFSTAERVGTVSGRGVGMDVVRTNIEQIGGSVEIASERGRGTLFTIKIPLTLAIVAALIVETAGHRFALPQTGVMELVQVRPGSDHALERIHGAPVLRLRENLLPVFDMAEMLGIARTRLDADCGFVVVAQVGRQRFGMLVEAVLETEEIVVKPMSARLRNIPVYSGNTILGDGTVVLIIDPNGIARRIGQELGQAIAEATGAGRPGQDSVQDPVEMTTLLVFKGADLSLKAVPLSLVTRLEEVDAASIERSGGRPCIQYRGRLMPVFPIDAGSMHETGPQPLIVVADGARQIAIAVSEIVDVIDVDLAVEPVPDRPDLVGSAIVGGRATEIVDLAPYLPAGAAGTRPDRPAIVLADPSPFFRDMLVPVLKAAGYQVRVAADRARALELVARGGVEALVTDLDLPGSDASERGGLALIEEMRRRPATADATILLLSSDADADALARARALGVFDVVAKFDRSGLLAALAEASSGAALDLAA